MLIALNRFSYEGRLVRPGRAFYARSLSDARVLILAGLARQAFEVPEDMPEDVPSQPVAETLTSEDAPHTPRRRRRAQTPTVDPE